MARLGDELSSSEARRVALGAQGFHRERPGKVDSRHVRRLIHDLGLVQIDFVNVLIPAQYQVLFSRLGPYRRSILDDLVYRRREFTEQFAHETSIVPVETSPVVTFGINEASIRLTSVTSVVKQACVSADNKPKSRAKSKWYSSSLADPIAIWRNRAKSPPVSRQQPSAMLAPIEAADRRIWLVKP